MHHQHKKYYTLSKKMNASGYCEKGLQSNNDDDMKKLASLLEEIWIIGEAESKLDSNN
jgi:valyl-tRNA synthetase